VFDYIPFPVFTHTTGMTHFQCQVKFGVWCAVSATSINGSMTRRACYNINCAVPILVPKAI